MGSYVWGMGAMCSNVYSAPRYVLRMYLGKGTYVPTYVRT
jgi:hypothetical protein